MPAIVQHVNPARSSEARQKGLSTLALKLIAICAMLIDHIAWAFLPESSALSGIMHLIGRIAAPVMCFCLCEGYHHTRSLRRYATRLAVFSLISHFAYAYFANACGFNEKKTSVISALGISLLCLHIYRGKEMPYSYRLPVIAMLAFAAHKTCDWGAAAVFFTLTFDIARLYGKGMQAKAYLLAAICYLLTKLELLTGSHGLSTHFYIFGVLLPIPLLLLYNGENGGGRHAKWLKWFFYFFYPAHLVLLVILKQTLQF